MSVNVQTTVVLVLVFISIRGHAYKGEWDKVLCAALGGLQTSAIVVIGNEMMLMR